MEPKILCPRWGKCKAKKKCPLSKETLKNYNIYVREKCANENVEIISFFSEWNKVIKKM